MATTQSPAVLAREHLSEETKDIQITLETTSFVPLSSSQIKKKTGENNSFS